MKIANNINELAALLKAGETEIKISFASCHNLYSNLRKLQGIDLCDYDLSKWNVSNVTNMAFMFYEAENFNQDLSDWSVGKVNDMRYMFHGAENFNQDISKWGVSNVTNMDSMFERAKRFNQDISNWDVSKARYMFCMFYRAVSFNQNLSDWNVNRITDTRLMFNHCPIEESLKPKGLE